MGGYPELQSSPAYQLWRAANAWQRKARKALEPLGLTHVQFMTLAAVDRLQRQGEAVMQVDVARFADFDENMTSQVVRGLETRGLVQRGSHPKDARARTIHLTEEGSNILRAGRAVVKPMTVAFFEPLGTEVEDLVAQLRILSERAEEDEPRCGC
jgi:DNA-binding MarR family transcriptional regulator